MGLEGALAVAILGVLWVVSAVCVGGVWWFGSVSSPLTRHRGTNF